MFVLFFVTGALITLSYYGRSEFQSAVDDISSTLNKLASRFEAIDSNVDDLSDQAVTYNSSAYDTHCTPSEVSTSLQEGTSEFVTTVNSMTEYLSGIADKIRNAADFVDEEIPPYIDYGVGSIVGAVWLVCLLGFLAQLTSCCSCDNCAVVVLATIVMLALSLLIGLEVALSVTFADFCYKGPDTAILLAAEDAGLDSQPLDLITYYVTCNGTNILDGLITDAQDQIDFLNNTVKNVTTSGAICTQSALNEIISTTKQSDATLEDMRDEVSCSAINPLYTDVFYGVFCDKFLKGLFILWIVQAAAGVAMYVAFCVYPYAAHPITDDDYGEDLDDFGEPKRDDMEMTGNKRGKGESSVV